MLICEHSFHQYISNCVEFVRHNQVSRHRLIRSTGSVTAIA